jgi:hypothetical protein
MPKYAQYDPAAAAPAPVLGWWDTDSFPHLPLPPPAELLALSEAQWEAHFAGSWAVSGGALMLCTPPPPSSPTTSSVAPSMAELLAELATLRTQVGQLHIS